MDTKNLIKKLINENFGGDETTNMASRFAKKCMKNGIGIREVSTPDGRIFFELYLSDGLVSMEINPKDMPQ